MACFLGRIQNLIDFILKVSFIYLGILSACEYWYHRGLKREGIGSPGIAVIRSLAVGSWAQVIYKSSQSSFVTLETSLLKWTIKFKKYLFISLVLGLRVWLTCAIYANTLLHSYVSRLLEFFNLTFILMYVSILPTICVLCPRRPEESIRSPGAIVQTVVRRHVGARTWI